MSCHVNTVPSSEVQIRSKKATKFLTDKVENTRTRNGQNKVSMVMT